MLSAFVLSCPLNSSRHLVTFRKGPSFVSKDVIRRERFSCMSMGKSSAAILTALAVSHCLIFQPPVLAAPEANAGNAPEIAVESVKEMKERSKRNSQMTDPTASGEFKSAKRLAILGNLGEAEAAYRRVTELVPDFAPGYSNLGNIYVARGSYEDAIKAYTTSNELAPLSNDSWLVLVNRGLVRLEVGDPRGALSDMNAAEKLAPKEKSVLAHRGQVWERMEKWDNALVDYGNALKDGNVQPFWFHYSLVLLQRNMPYEASGILNRLHASKYDTDEIRAAQAVVYWDRGLFDQAETAWSNVERPRSFTLKSLEERNWTPRAIEGMKGFRGKQFN